jgi:hypothetical protein
MGWALAAPLPLAVYTVLLAATDWGWGIAKRHFTRCLVVAVGFVYAVMAWMAW